MQKQASYQIGDRIQNRWEVHKILHGGMGLVYVVYDHEVPSIYAAKTFRDDLRTANPIIAERFTQEALVWINLDVHENITRARVVEIIEGNPYLFLEYISGGDLSQWIGTPRLTEDLPQVLRFAIQFCDGMTHALAKGIKAHRDIKPANCLITQDGTLKITDFGLAKVFGDAQSGNWLAGAASLPAASLGSTSPHKHGLMIGLTQAGSSAGTCTHMAPEQFEDVAKVNWRADIYSFGVLLFEMVTGGLPFSANTWAGFRQAHQEQEPPHLGSGQHELDTVVARCLAKQPDKRGEGFAQVREELAKLYQRLTGEVAPIPVSGTELKAEDWNNKATSLAALSQFNYALSCYEKALEVNPRHASAWSNKGGLLHNMGRSTEAIFCFESALEINPRLAEAWSNKGFVLAR